MEEEELKEKRGAGRPKADIDWDFVAKLCVRGASGVGVAATIGVDEGTIRKRCVTDNNCDFSEFRQKNLAKGDQLLKSKQYEVAMSGDKTMLIWLGKQRLDQSDKTASDVSFKGEMSVGFAAFAKAAEEMYGNADDVNGNGGATSDDTDGD